MIGDEDLRLAAEGLLAAHGAEAVRECEAVIATMMARGNEAGAENWTKILATLRQLRESGQ
jgi:hypothetical protein